MMDSASRLLVIDFEDKRETDRTILDISHLHGILKADLLKNKKVDLLICGAISMPLHRYIAAANIEIVPFICGAVEDVLAAYNGGVLQNGDFFQPGCRNNFSGPRCQRRRQRGRFYNTGRK